MKAYLKKDPTRLGRIAYVYTTDYGQKRLTVYFESEETEYTIDDAVENFEIFNDEGDRI